MRPAIFLFDIDGTLISSGGAGRRAVETAFERLHGRADACHGFSFAGMTDRAIARRALVGLGWPERGPETESAIDALLEAYLALLGDEVRGAPYHVHRGMREALDRLEGLADVAIGLGTGNVERGARIKLGPVELDARFAFGGFGCDAEQRGDLLRIGADRGAARLGRARADCCVVVIGDTPRDIEAARAISARAIAVATGPFSVDELRAAGADLAFADLAEAGALDAVLALAFER